MEFIKTHKKLCIGILIGLILLFLLTLLYRTLSVDYSKSEYGDRLDGIENVKISDKETSKLTSEMKDLEEVKDCTYRLQGRLVYISLTLNEEIGIDKAKELANKTLEYFDDDEKSYYDFEFILKSANKDAEGYPLMGYKHKTTGEIIW